MLVLGSILRSPISGNSQFRVSGLRVSEHWGRAIGRLLEQLVIRRVRIFGLRAVQRWE